MIKKLQEIKLSLLKLLLELLKKQLEETPTVIKPVEKPVYPILFKVKSIAWCGGDIEDRKKMFALAKQVCLEEKLSEKMTEDLLATIYGESGFNQYCINETSKDYGICQFSIRYYLPEYKMTTDEALNQPEKCIRIMAKNFKAGRQSNWVAYQNRSQYYTKMLELA